MRYLLLQSKKSDSNTVQQALSLVAQYGHQVVKWVNGVTRGIDYDAVIAFPSANEDFEDDAIDFWNGDPVTVEIHVGKGIYEGITEPNDMIVFVHPRTKDLMCISSFYKHRFQDSDYTMWGWFNNVNDTKVDVFEEVLRHEMVHQSLIPTPLNPNLLITDPIFDDYKTGVVITGIHMLGTKSKRLLLKRKKKSK